MTFTFDELKLARERGYSDDEIWNTLSSEDKEIGLAKERGYSLEEVASITSGQPVPEGFATRPVEPEPEQPFFALEDAVSAIGTIPEALAVGVPAAFQKLVTGTAMPKESEAIEKDIAFQERMRQEQEDRQAAGKSSMVGKAIREAAPSLSFSLGSMGAGVAGAVGGTVVGGPVGGTVGGMAASGTASYQMAAADLLYRSFKALEEQKGSPLTENEKAQAYKEFLPLAQNSALWEAGPEAVSNAVLLGAGKFVFGFGKPLARKLVGESIERVNKGIASKVAVGTSAVAAELGTETITALGQFAPEMAAQKYVRTGTTEGAPTEYPGGAMQAFKDVAPATLALTGMMAGAGGVVKAATLPFQKTKTPEQIEEDNISLDAEREADNLLIPDTDEESKSIKAQIDSERADLVVKKELYNSLPDGDKAKAVLATEIKEYEGRITELDNTLRQRLGLSVTITPVEQRQIELARGLAAEEGKQVTKTGKAIDPELTNSIGSMVGLRREGGLTLEEGFAYRSVSEGEVGSIAQEGYMITDPRLAGKEKKPRGQINQKMFSAFNPDAPNAAYGKGDIVLRVRAENVPVGTKGRAVRESDVEVLTYDGNQWVSQTPSQFVQSRKPAQEAAAQSVEQRQIELAREIAAPAEPAVAEAPAVTPAPPVTEAPVVTPTPAAEVAPVITEKVDDVVGEVERSSEQQSNTVKVFRGVAEAGNIPTGGTFFTDSEKDASAYAQLAALRQEIDRNEELNELVSEIMAEEGAEDVTDLSISTIKSIIEGNNIKVGDISEGAVLRGNINLGNVLNLESFGSEIGSLPETWNELNKLGLVPETWESLDEDTQFDLQDKYRGKAFYSLLEGEVNLNDQFEKGIDTVVFTDQNTEGKGTHRTYLTKAAEQFTQEAAPAEAAPTGIAVGSRIKLGKSPQTYTIEEVLPQSEAERGLGEQFYSVKNERTGEVQTVESKDLKPVLARVRRGEKGGVLFLTREDFIQAGQNIYEAGMEFATWARQMVQRFGDAVRQFLGDIWQAVSGIPAKVNELVGFLPGKGEAGAVAFGRGEEPPKPPKKPAEPAPEKPAGEKPTEPEKPKERGTLARMAITAFKTTPKGILAKTTKIIKDSVFDGDSEISDAATNRAWTLINNLVATNEKSVANAEAINQLTREAMTEVKAPEGATSEEVKTFEVVKQTVGMPKLRNELFKYAIKLTGQGDKRMLDYLLNNELNLAGSSIKTKEDIGRFLGALRGISSYIITATEAEQAGFFNIAAQQFFNTKNPTPEQVQQIKDIFNKVKKVKIDQEKELMTELEDVGKAAGVDLPNIVQKELDTAPGLDPMVVAIQNLLRMGGTFTYRPTKNKIGEAVNRTITQGITNYRKKMVSKAATGLEAGFWKTLASTEDKPGPLGELDAAQNRALGNIVKQTLVAMGLKGAPPDTKMSIYEQVASILGEQPLGKDKMNLADEKIRGGIEAGRNAELENASEDQADAINSKWDAIQFAWDESMSRSLDMPVSDTMLRRLIANEIKDEKTSIQELATLMDEEPAIGTSRQDRLVNSIIEKVSGITFDGQPTRDYTALKKYLSDMLENIVQARQQKNAAAKSMAKVKRGAAGDPDKQAQAQIDKLAKIQADPTIFGEKKIDPVRNAVRDALSLKLDIGFTPEQTADIKRNWKGAYVADPNKKGIPTSFMLEMQRLGVSEAAADTLYEIVWKQIEVNAMNRQMDATTKAVEAGPLGGMVQAILDTPLAMQQDPEWRKKVITDYLKNAGIKANRADRIAELFDVSLRKRFAKAQEEAAISAAKSLKGGLNPASRRAFEKFLKAIRAQVLDPGTDVAKAFGEQMGWTGFTAEQITRLNELDAIVNDTNRTDSEIAVAIEQINKIIDKVSAPPQVKDILASYYVGNILGRITTFTIQALDPLAFTTFNAAVDSFRNITNPQQLMSVWSNYGRGVSNLIRETAFSFKNNVLRSGKIIDYMARQDRQNGRLWDEAVKKWNAGDIRGAMKDGIFGYTAWTFRTLKALDDGAYSLLTTTTLPSYVDAALKRAKVPAEKRRGVMRGILEARELDIKNMVEQGIPRNDAIVYANEKMRGEVTKVLTGMNIDAQEVIDSAINDALSRIGKTRFKEDIHGNETEIKDLGRLSAPFLRFYEAVAKSVNEKSGSESQKIFYRILLGFPLIPARIFNIAAGYTPLTIYRHFLKNRYSLTYGTALQRRQRIIEQMAGTAVLLPLLFLRSNSLDEEDEKEKGFGIYITGQGPSRTMDRETRAQWDKRFDPYSIVFRVGNKSASIDARAAGPLSVMIYTLGAIDDWENRRKQEGLKTSKDDWRDVHEKASLFTAMYELAGSFALTTARRGPTTGVIQGLVDFRSYPDDPIAAIGKEVAFSGMPAVPVLGTGIVKNLSDLFSQPIDNKTKEGAILANIPIVGPVAGQPALNAYGQRIGELRVSEKLKKSFGLPFTLITSDSEDDTKLTSLTLKFGNGPTPIRREEVENELKDVISDEEWYLAAKTFGNRNREKVLAAYNRYDKMKPDRFNDAINRLTTESKNAAIRAVKQQRRNRP